jgi:hypothetical protein
MKRVALFIFLVFWGFFQAGYGQGSETRYDVEYARICLIDSIAPDTLVQFWRFTQANNPGALALDYTFDLAGGYTVAGTVLPCCSCLTAASDTAGFSPCQPTGIGWGWKIAIALVLLLAASWLISVWGLLEFGRRYQKAARIAYILLISILFSYSSLSAQSETTYDVEYQCICLVDSIAPGNVVQFWRFTQANNPGALALDYTFDLAGGYTVAGTVMGCNDYYLGDNVNSGGGTAGTLPIWTGANTLGNSSLSEASGVLSSSLTGALKLPAGTDAQDPVWSTGMLRYNTTTAGLQGYNGAERYLPWSDNDNFTTAYIPYSNGSSLTTSADLGFYIVTGSNRLGVLNAKLGTTYAGTIRGRLDVSGQAGDHTSYFECTGSTFSSSIFSVNTNVNGWGPFFVLPENSNKPNLFLGESNTIQRTSQKETIKISGNNSTNNNGNFFVGVNGGKSISWEYSRSIGPSAQPSYKFESARIVPICTANVYGDMETGLRFYNTVANTLTYTAQLDSAGLILPLYAPGTLTGTPATTAAFNSSGRLIQVPEKWAAISTSTDASGDIVVAHGMGATPTSVQVTVTGTTPYVVTVHSIDATNFTVRFYDMTGAAVASTAVTATWHAKT